MNIEITEITVTEEPSIKQINYLDKLLVKNPFKNYNRNTSSWSNISSKILDKKLVSELIDHLLQGGEISWLLNGKKASKAAVLKHYFKIG